MKRPLLSVITFNYNYAQYLPRALSSIAQQDFDDMEYILLDDGSTDNSVAIFQEFADQHPYSKFYQRKENKGLFYTYRETLHMAKGKYIYWLASDDYVLPGFFKETIGLLEQHPSMKICSSFSNIFAEEDTSLDDKVKSSKKELRHIKKGYYEPDQISQVLRDTRFWIASTGTICDRGVLLENNYPYAELMRLGDWFLNYQLAFRYGIGIIPECFAFFQVHSTAYSQAMNELNAESIRKKKQMYEAFLQKLAKEKKEVRRRFIYSNRFLDQDRFFLPALLKRPQFWYALPALILRKAPRYLRNCLKKMR